MHVLQLNDPKTSNDTFGGSRALLPSLPRTGASMRDVACGRSGPLACATHSGDRQQSSSDILGELLTRDLLKLLWDVSFSRSACFARHVFGVRHTWGFSEFDSRHTWGIELSAHDILGGSGSACARHTWGVWAWRCDIYGGFWCSTYDILGGKQKYFHDTLGGKCPLFTTCLGEKGRKSSSHTQVVPSLDDESSVFSFFQRKRSSIKARAARGTVGGPETTWRASEGEKL